MSKKLEILKYFRNHLDKELAVKDLCKEFNMSQPAMWKNVRELWIDSWIVKTGNSIPTKYKFNELFLVLITKT